MRLLAGGKLTPQAHHSVQGQQCCEQAQSPAHGRLRSDFHPYSDHEEDHCPETKKADDDVEIFARPDQPAAVARPRGCAGAGTVVRHLTAPAVRPATILRWKTSTRITSGIV